MPPDGDDIVDRATQALREMPVPDGPSPQLVAITQQALLRESAGVTHWMSFRRFPIFRLAAAIVIGCSAIAVYWVVTHRAKPGTEIVHPGSETHPNVPTQDPWVAPPSHIQQQTGPSLVRHDPPVMPTPAAPVLADGVIAGRVIFDGVAPQPKRLAEADAMPDCTRVHGGPIYGESLVVNREGGLANVVISVSDGLSSWLREEFPPRAEPTVLDQKGCVFTPHVVAVMVGQPLQIKNSDPLAHNVNVMAVNNIPANLGQPGSSETETEKFQSPEVFRVKCDMHPWMEAWVRVLDNPYFAVTGADGRFSLRGLPPGTYTIKAWHEQLGVKEMQVTISPGRGAALDFTFRPLPK
jgi:plastocyanin